MKTVGGRLVFALCLSILPALSTCQAAHANTPDSPTVAIDDDGIDARVTGDTPMYLGNLAPEKAPFIGFLRAGTPIFQHTTHKYGKFIVAGVPFLIPNKNGVLRAGFQDKHSEDYLHVYLAAQTGTPPKAMTDIQHVAGTNQYGLFREISIEPGQPGYAFVHCGKIRVIERRGHWMRVAAEYDSGELYGWIAEAAPGTRDRICDTVARTNAGWQHPFHDLPLGYEVVNEKITEPKVLALSKTKATLFRPEPSQDGWVCRGWKFSPSRNPSQGKLILESSDLPPDYSTIFSNYGIKGSTLSVLHPVSRRKDGAVITAGCISTFSVVRTFAKHLLLVPGSLSPGIGLPPVVGFRVSTALRWHLDREACVQALSVEGATRPAPCCWEIPTASAIPSP